MSIQSRMTVAEAVREISRSNPYLGQQVTAHWKQMLATIHVNDRVRFYRLQEDLFHQAMQTRVVLDLEEFFSSPDFFFPKALARLVQGLAVLPPILRIETKPITPIMPIRKNP